MHRPKPTAGLLKQPSSSNTSGRLGSVEELLGNNRASLKRPKARRSGYFECIDSVTASGSQAPPPNPRGTRLSMEFWNYIPTAPAVENAISVRTNTVRARMHPDNHIRCSFIENLVPSFFTGVLNISTLYPVTTSVPQPVLALQGNKC